MSLFLHQPHLHALLMNALRLCAWLLLLSVVFLPLERLFAVVRARCFLKPLPGMSDFI